MNSHNCCYQKRGETTLWIQESERAFEDLCPKLLEAFDIRSILTLCVENAFSEMHSGTTDRPIQLEFHRRFPRAVLRETETTIFLFF